MIKGVRVEEIVESNPLFDELYLKQFRLPRHEMSQQERHVSKMVDEVFMSVAKGKQGFFLLDDDDQIKAAASVTESVERIYVDVLAATGDGNGRLLIKDLMQIAQAANKPLVLDAMVGSEGFYEKMGLQRVRPGWNEFAYHPKSYKDAIQAGKYKWKHDEGAFVGQGGEAYVYDIPGHADKVAVFTGSELKRDWYEYNDWLLGEAPVPKGGFVYVIPKMKYGADPSWLDPLKHTLDYGLNPADFTIDLPKEYVRVQYGGTWGGTYIQPLAAIEVMPILEILKDNPPRWYNAQAQEIMDHLAGFFNEYPKWLSGSVFDLNFMNVMRLDGKIVFSDPLNKKR